MRPVVGALIAGSAAVSLVLGSPSLAVGASAPDSGRAFEPHVKSRAIYAIEPPSEDPLRQRHLVAAADGVRLYVETWLPAAKEGRTPPAKLPTVLVYSPYLTAGQQSAYARGLMVDLVSRGYAYAAAHVRGTGESGGCIEQTGRREREDGARIVEYLGRDAPWASGAVGMVGQSYPGATQIGVASHPDRARTRYLKAIVPGAPVASYYDFRYQDGVPMTLGALGGALSYFFVDSFSPVGEGGIPRQLERAGCQPEKIGAGLEVDGRYTEFSRERDLRADVENIRAAVLTYHGHPDVRVPSLMQAGFFERLPATTFKAGVFGIFDHEPPDSHHFQQPPVQPDWERPDWRGMTIAWLDRFLKGLPTGVEHWPVAQVQGTDGQWRAESEWPTTGGSPGQLALSAGGLLGDSSPTGADSYTELGLETTEGGPPDGAAVRWQTQPLPRRLELSGQPGLALWVSVDRPAANIVAKLEAVGPDGHLITPESRVFGARSVRFRAPLRQNRFVQSDPVAPPVGVPFRVALRFRPADLVVPSGGRLRLTIAGSLIGFDGLDGVEEGAGALVQGPTQPSLSATRVTVHHDCTHPSVLRFLMPSARPLLLNVREKDEHGALNDQRRRATRTADGGGISRTAVCGDPPARLAIHGPPVAAGRTVGGCLTDHSPTTRMTALSSRRRRITAAGTAAGVRCEGRSTRVRAVRVAVSRVLGRGRCRAVLHGGRFAPTAACARRRFSTAVGSERWRSTSPQRLRRGLYVVAALAEDDATTAERRLQRGRNLRFIRVQ